MKYIAQFISRTTTPSSSFSLFSPFPRRIKRTKDTGSSKKQQRGQGSGEQQSTAGPSAGNNLQLNDLLADSFRNVRTPLAETNGDGEVVVDSSVCYDVDCQICEQVHECPALLRTLERMLTDCDGSFGYPFPRRAPTVELDPWSAEDIASTSSREGERRQQAGRKDKQRRKGRSKAKGGTRSSGWSKVRIHLSQLFPHKSAPNLSTRNESPLAARASPTPSKPRFTKGFARLRHTRRKAATVDL